MNFVRSAPAPDQVCKLGARQQLNQLTSFIDGSQIYGSNKQRSDQLRTFSGGKLKASFLHGKPFLPFSNSSGACRLPRGTQMRCFMAGDMRVNEQFDLSVMHLMWLREHNRIADELARLNPGWNDEILYQETRRIIAAQLQHIVYNEFVPIILGKQLMNKFNLLLTRNGFSQGYSTEINPGIISSFATAAYRLHTLVPGVIELGTANNQVLDRIELKDQFNSPQVMFRQNVADLLVNGLTGQPVQNGNYYFFSS